MIKPTLFIGLGTTGIEILKYLRRLIYEEFGRAGLPIFRYLTIDTDAAVSGEDPELLTRMESYERIDVVHAVITNLSVIEDKLDPGNPMYNEHLADWLDPDLLWIPGQSFQDGAANIRMAGRLCLWENWREVQSHLESNLHATTAPNNIHDTQAFLLAHYQRKGITPPNKLIDTVGSDIYVVGSICGGTCGGMMIDLAYFLRYLTGALLLGYNGGYFPGIYGIFTMYDSMQAHQPENSVRAANCFATLLELDFYNEPETTYNITFPDGTSMSDIKEPPFDYMMFVSGNGKDHSIRFVTPDGRFDEEGLNQMVAMNLFADAVGDTDGMKEAIRVDWMAHPEYRMPKPGPIPGIELYPEQTQQSSMAYIRCLSTFGLSAVWYPKLRIATAAACRIGSSLCQAWLRPCENRIQIEAEAKGAWDSILTNIDKLTSPDDGQPLKVQIESLLSEAENLFARSSSADELARMMRDYPQEESFRQKFGKNGEYYDLIDKQTPLFKDALKEALRDMLRNQVNKIDFEGQYSLGDVKYFFEVIDEEIQRYIEACPTQLPMLDNSRLDFSKLRKAESSLLLRLTFRRKSAIQQHKEELIEQYRKLVLDSYINLRNFFVRSVLEDLRAEIGISMPAYKDEYEERTTIKRLLDAIDATLKDCSYMLERDYRYEVKPPKQINVEIVANNPDNNIEREVERLSGRMVPADASMDLLEGKTFFEFLRQGQESILIQIKEVYRYHALRQIESFHVVTKAQQILATVPNPVALLAHRSNPYQRFHARYRPAMLPIPPRLISGHSPTPGDLDILRAELEIQGYTFNRISESMVDHLLFFYQEESAFAPDDLAAYHLVSRSYGQTPGGYGHHTHKDPMMFDRAYFHRKRKLRRWVEAVIELTPLIRQEIPDVFQDVLREDERGLFYVYVNDFHLTRRFDLDDQRDIDRLARPENKFGYDNFIYLVQVEFRRIGQGNIIRLIRTLLQNLPPEEYTQKRDFYQRILDEVFPEVIEPSEDLIGIPSCVQRPDETLQETETTSEESEEAEDDASSSQINGAEMETKPYTDFRDFWVDLKRLVAERPLPANDIEDAFRNLASLNQLSVRGFAIDTGLPAVCRKLTEMELLPEERVFWATKIAAYTFMLLASEDEERRNRAIEAARVILSKGEVPHTSQSVWHHQFAWCLVVIGGEMAPTKEEANRLIEATLGDELFPPELRTYIFSSMLNQIANVLIGDASKYKRERDWLSHFGTHHID